MEAIKIIETNDTKSMQIPPELHRLIKISASVEGLSIKDFIGKLYGLYVYTKQQSAHQ
jgi:hypothetical protein